MAIASISFDHESGIFAGGAVAATTNGDDIGVLRGAGHIGYAHSLDHNLAVNGGLVINAYSDRYSGGTSQTFAEIFGGVTWGQFALHASYSPSYLDQGLNTLYIEFDAVQDLGSGFRVNAHAGLITRLSGTGSLGGADTRYDAQIGLTKDFDRLSVFINAGRAGSGQGTYFDGAWQGRNSVIIGLSRSF